jgi:hypothetical protein
MFGFWFAFHSITSRNDGNGRIGKRRVFFAPFRLDTLIRHKKLFDPACNGGYSHLVNRDFNLNLLLAALLIGAAAGF